MIAHSVFSGLVRWLCALASAAAMALMVGLERCMGHLDVQQIEADRAILGAFGTKPMPRGFLGVIWTNFLRPDFASS